MATPDGRNDYYIKPDNQSVLESLDEMIQKAPRGSPQYQRLITHFNKYAKSMGVESPYAGYESDDYRGLRFDPKEVQEIDAKIGRQLDAKVKQKKDMESNNAARTKQLEKLGYDEAGLFTQLDADYKDAVERFGEGSKEAARINNYRKRITGQGELLDDNTAGLAWDSKDQQEYDKKYKKLAKLYDKNNKIGEFRDSLDPIKSGSVKGKINAAGTKAANLQQKIDNRDPEKNRSAIEYGGTKSPVINANLPSAMRPATQSSNPIANQAGPDSTTSAGKKQQGV